MPERPAAGHSPPGEGPPAGWVTSLLFFSTHAHLTHWWLAPAMSVRSCWWAGVSTYFWGPSCVVHIQKGTGQPTAMPTEAPRWGPVIQMTRRGPGPETWDQRRSVGDPWGKFWYWPPRVRFHRWSAVSSTRPPSRQPPTAVFRLPSRPTFLTNWIQIQEFPLLKPPPTPSFSNLLELGKHRLLPLPRTVFPPFFKQLASHHSGLNTNASFSENFSKLPTVSQSCNGVLLPWWHLSEIHY